jgi:hypothetical protein
MPPISWITLVKNAGWQTTNKSLFQPFSIDSLHNGKLAVYFTVNSKTDSLRLDKGITANIGLSKTLMTSCRFVTLKMQNRQYGQFLQNLLIDKDYIEPSVFSRVWELVHGLPSKVVLRR